MSNVCMIYAIIDPLKSKALDMCYFSRFLELDSFPLVPDKTYRKERAMYYSRPRNSSKIESVVYMSVFS